MVSLSVSDGLGYDVSPELSVGVTLSAAAQNQWISSDLPVDDFEAGAAGIVQPEVAWRPWSAGEFYAKLGFAAGNGINQDTPFYLAPGRQTWKTTSRISMVGAAIMS